MRLLAVLSLIAQTSVSSSSAFNNAHQVTSVSATPSVQALRVLMMLMPRNRQEGEDGDNDSFTNAPELRQAQTPSRTPFMFDDSTHTVDVDDDDDDDVDNRPAGPGPRGQDRLIDYLMPLDTDSLQPKPEPNSNPQSFDRDMSSERLRPSVSHADVRELLTNELTHIQSELHSAHTSFVSDEQSYVNTLMQLESRLHQLRIKKEHHALLEQRGLPVHHTEPMPPMDDDEHDFDFDPEPETTWPEWRMDAATGKRPSPVDEDDCDEVCEDEVKPKSQPNKQDKPKSKKPANPFVKPLKAVDKWSQHTWKTVSKPFTKSFKTQPKREKDSAGSKRFAMEDAPKDMSVMPDQLQTQTPRNHNHTHHPTGRRRQRRHQINANQSQKQQPAA